MHVNNPRPKANDMIHVTAAFPSDVQSAGRVAASALLAAGLANPHHQAQGPEQVHQTPSLLIRQRPYICQ